MFIKMFIIPFKLFIPAPCMLLLAALGFLFLGIVLGVLPTSNVLMTFADVCTSVIR